MYIDSFIEKHIDYVDYYSKFYYFDYCCYVLEHCTDFYYSQYKKDLFAYSQYKKMSLSEFQRYQPVLFRDKTVSESILIVMEFRDRMLSNAKKWCSVFSYYNKALSYISSLSVEDMNVFSFIAKKIKCCPLLFSYLEKVKKAHCRSLNNLRRRINNIINKNDNIYFVTFTFNDKSLSLDKKTRRVYVSRLCRDCCSDYVANLDYGKKNEREHYHGVLSINDVALFDMRWSPYGFYYLEKITDNEKSRACLTRYTNKLVTHALKHGADSIIYSRKGG